MGFIQQQEEWVPCSPWGWWRKAENEKYMREQAEAQRAAKRKPQSEPKPKRIRVRVAVCRDHGSCKVCSNPLGPQNKSGVCSKCYSKHRAVAKGPRPACPECGKLMSRSNKSGVCRKCYRAPMKQAKCKKCDNLLHPNNTTGLCTKHTGAARQRAYMERKKAA